MATIYLNQNTANTVYMTLSENVTYTGSPIYFLFKLTNMSTKTEKLFSATDDSANIVRYNQFNFILTGSTAFENLTAGTISILPDSEHKIEAYEMLNRSNLQLSGTSGVVLETNLIKVSGTTINNLINSYTGQSTTFGFYDGQGR